MLDSSAEPAARATAHDARVGGVVDGQLGMAALDRRDALPVGRHQRLVRQDVDETRHAAAALRDLVDRAPLEQAHAVVAGEGETMRQIGVDAVRIQRQQFVAERDALAKLADRGLVEHLIEFGLTEQHDLHELALLGLEVGQQAQDLQSLQRYGLRFVHADDDALARGRELQQRHVEPPQQLVLRARTGQTDAEFLDHRQQQARRAQVRIRQVGAAEISAQRIDQPAAQQRLAGTDFADHLDESFAAAQGDEQHVQPVEIARTLHEEGGVGGQRERQFTESEMLQVHGCPRWACTKAQGVGRPTRAPAGAPHCPSCASI